MGRVEVLWRGGGGGGPAGGRGRDAAKEAAPMPRQGEPMHLIRDAHGSSSRRGARASESPAFPK
jgi:hypothetical protein